MAFHRIKKYSRQIVCQDMVLSCQTNHIEEIPLFKRAGITAVSLRNQRTDSSGERSSWAERDLDLSGMLVNWHLWNSRSVPLSTAPSRIEKTRRAGTEKRGKVGNSSLTLRKESLYMAIEKFLLFLMPREMANRRTISMLDQSCSRRARVRFSALYVDTALGFRQYQLVIHKTVRIPKLLPKPSFGNGKDKTKLQNTLCKRLLNDKEQILPERIPGSLILSSERISFPSVNADKSCSTFSLKSLSVFPQVGTSKVWPDLPPTSLKKAGRITDRSYRLVRPTLSLHCSSVLGSPDIQDIAQSGLMTLEGSLALELS